MFAYNTTNGRKAARRAGPSAVAATYIITYRWQQKQFMNKATSVFSVKKQQINF